MAKKTINIDILLGQWEQIYPTIYYAALNDYCDLLLKDTEFVFEKQPFDVSKMLANTRLLVSDKRWEWRGDSTPYEIMRSVSRDWKWEVIHDCGPVHRASFSVSNIIESDRNFKGNIARLKLKPSWFHVDIEPSGYVDYRPNLVLAFEYDEDWMYWKMKYSK